MHRTHRITFHDTSGNNEEWNSMLMEAPISGTGIRPSRHPSAAACRLQAVKQARKYISTSIFCKGNRIYHQISI
jgi:hypothetical protein